MSLGGCKGGFPGLCNQKEGPWSRRQVTCKPEVENELVDNVPGIGAWGGQCTCPDGTVYDVGDKDGEQCAGLDAGCIGGIPGTCNRHAGPWSHKKVICEQPYTWTEPLPNGLGCNKGPCSHCLVDGINEPAITGGTASGLGPGGKPSAGARYFRTAEGYTCNDEGGQVLDRLILRHG